MKRFYLLFLLSISVLIAGPSLVTAQNGSYLDTIYNANQQGASSDRGSDVSYVCPNAQATAGVSLPNSDENIGNNPESDKMAKAQQRAADRLQRIIQAIINAIAGKMGNGRVIIIIIPPASPNQPEPPTILPEPPVTDPGSGTIDVPNPEPQPDPAPQPDPSPAPAPKPDPAPQPDPAPSADTQPNPAPSADTQSAAGLKAMIQSKYGVNAADGDRAKWTEKEYSACAELLDELPKYFRSPTKEIRRDGPPLPGMPNGVLGYVMGLRSPVHIMDMAVTAPGYVVARYGKERAMQMLKKRFMRTMCHEMTHCFQGSHMDVTRAWSRNFWPNGQNGGPAGTCPTAYGRSQPVEDMAESVATYWEGGTIQGNYFVTGSGAKMDINRYNFIKKYVMNGKEFKPR